MVSKRPPSDLGVRLGSCHSMPCKGVTCHVRINVVFQEFCT